MTPRTRRQLAGAWAMVPFALLLVGARVWQPPGELPTRWSGSSPDGFTDGGTVLLTTLTVAGFCSILAALVALVRVFVPGRWSRWIVTLLATVSCAAAAAYGVGAWATSLAGLAAAVHPWWVALVVVLAVLCGVVAHRVHGLEVPSRAELLHGIPERSRVVPVTRPDPAVGRAAAGGDCDERAPGEWTGRSASRLLVGLSIYTGLVFAVCVALLLFGGPHYRLLLVAVLVVGVPLTLFVLAWSRVRVVVDAGGLRVRSERLPVTLLRVRPAEVLGVQVLDVDPMAWGGYGLRATAGATAYIVHGGDALVVHRANGRRLALECVEGEPRVGAAVLLRVAGQALADARSGSAVG